MKRLNFAVMLMMSLVVISCSKEDDEYLQDNSGIPMELDMSSVQYPYQRIDKGEDYFSHYIIELPLEETEVFLKPNTNLTQLELGVFKVGRFVEPNIYTAETWVNPESSIWFNLTGPENHPWDSFEFKSPLGDVCVYDDCSFACRLTEKEDKFGCDGYFTEIFLSDIIFPIHTCRITFLQKKSDSQ